MFVIFKKILANSVFQVFTLCYRKGNHCRKFMTIDCFMFFGYSINFFEKYNSL